MKAESKNGTSEDERESSGGTLAVILLIIIAFWSVVAWLAWPNEAPKFEDTFSAVNALFSGLAFATLIFTVFLQRRELALQRKELEYTREELKRSATAQEASEKALKAQADAAAQSADIAAISQLLPYYRGITAPIAKQQLHHSEPWKSRFIRYKEREQALNEILDSIYHRITTEHANKQQEQSGAAKAPPSPENRP